jgi:hypothetical protein
MTKRYLARVCSSSDDPYLIQVFPESDWSLCDGTATGETWSVKTFSCWPQEVAWETFVAFFVSDATVFILRQQNLYVSFSFCEFPLNSDRLSFPETYLTMTDIRYDQKWWLERTWNQGQWRAFAIAVLKYWFYHRLIAQRFRNKIHVLST